MCSFVGPSAKIFDLLFIQVLVSGLLHGSWGAQLLFHATPPSYFLPACARGHSHWHPGLVLPRRPSLLCAAAEHATRLQRSYPRLLPHTATASAGPSPVHSADPRTGRLPGHDGGCPSPHLTSPPAPRGGEGRGHRPPGMEDAQSRTYNADMQIRSGISQVPPQGGKHRPCHIGRESSTVAHHTHGPCCSVSSRPPPLFIGCHGATAQTHAFTSRRPAREFRGCMHMTSASSQPQGRIAAPCATDLVILVRRLPLDTALVGFCPPPLHDGFVGRGRFFVLGG